MLAGDALPELQRSSLDIAGEADRQQTRRLHVSGSASKTALFQVQGAARSRLPLRIPRIAASATAVPRRTGRLRLYRRMAG
jgi:hypothetical protein